MRIVQVIPTYLPAVRYGGPIITTHALSAALVALGHQVQVVTTNMDGPGESAVPLDRPVELDGVQVHYFPVPHLRRLHFSSAMGRGLWSLLRGASVLHMHSVFPAPTAYRSDTRPASWTNLLPRAGSLETSATAIAEQLSYRWYSLRGDL